MKNSFLKRVGCIVTASLMIAAYTPDVTQDLPFFTAQITAEAASTVIKLNVKNGAKIGKALNKALLDASKKATSKKIYTVKVPKGTYILDETLHMYSNTTLDVTGCTLKSNNSFHNLLMFGTNGTYKGVKKYNSSKSAKGYASCVNVKIKGGTWVGHNKNKATLFRLAHAKNVTLEKMTIKGGNYSSHQVETAAINGLYIKNCTFKDYKPIDYLGKGHYECIQIDIPCNSKAYKDCYLDGTPSKNIEITGCKFTNVSRGLGTHSMLVGAYHDNVKITDNTFTNIQEEAIVALNYKNCTISRNKIVNAGGGILFENAKFLDSGSKIDSMYTTTFDGKTAYNKSVVYNVNSTISDNTMTIIYTPQCDRIQGIRVHGLDVTKAVKGGDGKKIAKKNYYISGVTVKNNKITTAGYGIFIDDARSTKCTGNTITQKAVSSKDSYKDKYDGIFVSSGCKTITLENNIIKSFKRNGIFLMTNSAANKIYKNNISGCGKNGIYLYDGSSGGAISSNTVTSCTENGIVLNTSCKASSISSNTLTGFGGSGVYINQSSAVSGAVSGNTINTCTGSGIVANNSSSAGLVSNNKINGMKKHGIFVYSGSKVTGSVSGNTVDKCDVQGIAVGEKSSAASIKDNIVSNIGSNAVYVYSGSTVSGDVSANTVDTANIGININSQGTVSGLIKDNIVTNTIGRDIRISADSKAQIYVPEVIQQEPEEQEQQEEQKEASDDEAGQEQQSEVTEQAQENI